MKSSGTMLAGLALGLLAAAFLPATGVAAERWAFIGVNVLPMDMPGELRGRDVLVEDGRIAAIRPTGEGELPEGTRRIEAAGAWLMPGLAEMHAHVPGESSEQWARDVLYLYAANGITLARGMLGQPWHLELRRDLAEQRVVGPRLYTSGPSLNGNSVSSPAEAVAMVTSQHDAGYDFIKIHPGLTGPEFDALAGIARALDMPFAGHVSAEVGLFAALEAGQASIDHLDQYMEALVPPDVPLPPETGFFGSGLAGLTDPDRIPVVARITAEFGTWNVPTQILIENFVLPDPPEALSALPGMRYVPGEMLERWQRTKAEILADPGYDAESARAFVETRRRLIGALHRAGAGLLLGSDAPQVFNVPGYSIHRELAALVAAGLTPREALATGTVNPARFFGAEDVFGAVRVGLAGDLVLLAGNPAEDLSALERPLGVMLRGRWLDRAELDRGLAAIAERYAR